MVEMSGSDMARYGKSIKHGKLLQGTARATALSVFSTLWSSGASGSRSLNELCFIFCMAGELLHDGVGCGLAKNSSY